MMRVWMSAICAVGAFGLNVSAFAEPPAPGKTAIVVSPAAYAIAKANSARPSGEVGQASWVDIGIFAGPGGGLRLDVFPYTGESFKVGVEGQLGLAGSNTGLSAGIGTGLRLQLRLASDHEHNALLVSPGVDVLVAPGTPGESWVHLGPYSNLWFIASDAELAWLHQFAQHFGFELGVFGGADVSLGGKGSNNQDTAGVVSPRVGLFTGFRF